MRRTSAKREAELIERRDLVWSIHARDRDCRARHRAESGTHWCLAPDEALASSARSQVRSIVCWGPLDVHEVLPKGRGGDWLDADNCLLVCRGHHDWITEHPALAEQVGLVRVWRHDLDGGVE